jgi:hypothetical protein
MTADFPERLGMFDWRTILPIAPFLAPWIDLEKGGAEWSPSASDLLDQQVRQELYDRYEQALATTKALSVLAPTASLAVEKGTMSGPFLGLVLAGSLAGLAWLLSRAIRKSKAAQQ